MTSISRQIAVSLLCGMISLGHVPAWLHIAGCSGHQLQAKSTPQNAEGVTCSHGCSHRATDPGTSTETIDSEGNSSLPIGHDHEHNSDTCALCQSLASITGVLSQSSPAPSGDIGLCESVIDGVTGPISTPLLDPQPRGPPALSIA